MKTALIIRLLYLKGALKKIMFLLYHFIIAYAHFIIAYAHFIMKRYTNYRLLILTLLLYKYRIYPYNKKYKGVLSHRLLMDILLFMDNLIFRYLLLLVVLLYNLLILILKSSCLNLLILFYLNRLLMDCLLIHWYLRQV